MKCDDCNNSITKVYHRYEYNWDEWELEKWEIEYDICKDCYLTYKL